MKLTKLYDLLAKAKQRSKNPCQWSYNDVKCIREAEGLIHGAKLDAEREKVNRKKFFDRSGILPLHEHCSIDNYLADCPGKVKAKEFASNYINRFYANNGQGFIFAGETGTGKNHLAAAICNAIMKDGKSCLIITVADLMVLMRKCYGKNPDMKEAVFIKKMIMFDLLVIDEIGLQRGTDNEKLIINQIIDSRVNMIKPTGILTNSDSDTLESILGARIMRRMLMKDGKWLPFNWESYKK